jgi:hypothetical protein
MNKAGIQGLPSRQLLDHIPITLAQDVALPQKSLQTESLPHCTAWAGLK